MAALLLLAQAIAPHAEEELQAMARQGEHLVPLMLATAILGPFAAGEALAAWGGPVVAPLLRALPVLTAWALATVTLRGERHLADWMERPVGRQSLREQLFLLPPLPLDPKVRTTLMRRRMAASVITMVWGLSALLLMAVYALGVENDLLVGNIVWQAGSVATAVKLTLLWALPLGIGWPVVVTVGLLWFLGPSLLLGLVLLWHFVLIPMARRRWWQAQLGPGGEGISLSRGQAEAWLKIRRRWPRFLLAWWYGSGEAIGALDRAARKALQEGEIAGLTGADMSDVHLEGRCGHDHRCKGPVRRGEERGPVG